MQVIFNAIALGGLACLCGMSERITAEGLNNIRENYLVERRPAFQQANGGYGVFTTN